MLVNLTPHAFVLRHPVMPDRPETDLAGPTTRILLQKLSEA